METPLYYVLTTIDLNCRVAPWPGTGDLPPLALPKPILANSVIQVVGESAHKPDPNNVWLNINIWKPGEAAGEWLSSTGWVRQKTRMNSTSPWFLTGKVIYLPPETFQTIINIAPSDPHLDSAMRFIYNYMTKL